MIKFMVHETVEIITEEFRDMKSNIINIQEEDDNSDYKRRFWGNVLMMLVYAWLIMLTIVLIFRIIYLLAISVELKDIPLIIIVVVVVYAMFKTEVLYKLLYKLLKKDGKENDK